MKKILILLSLSFFSSQTSFGSESYDLEDKGYFPENSSVLKNYQFLSEKLDENNLIKIIKRANYKLPKEEIKVLAQAIIKVSACFNIDPWFMTALIHKESSFEKTAVSPTNAAGLTQFTSSGIREVHDQLGQRPYFAHRKNIEYFQEKIKSCIDPNWENIWTKIGSPEENENFFNDTKNVIKEDVTLAVTYGAILLKTYLAHIDSKDVIGETQLSMEEKYFMALRNYNGEPGINKFQYAKTTYELVKKMYPKELNISFIDNITLPAPE